MKTVQDKNGNIIKVPNDTPCHPGKDGALPIVLDPVLDADIFAEMKQREDEWNSKADERLKDKIRADRFPLLQEADFEINKLEDDGLDSSQWRQYRKKLRNLTDGLDPSKIKFPKKPS